MKEYVKPEIDYVSLLAQEVITSGDDPEDDAIGGEWGNESSWFD